LETIAAAKGVVAPVMLRVTVGVEAHTHDFIATAHEDQKFGLSVSAGKASAAAARVVDSAHLRLDGLTEEAVQARMTKAWRKNIRRSAREGVEVTPGGRDDLGDVHRLFVETAERNGFAPQ
ncbi:hypothetical protein DN545_40555, partial [Burkholderia multivorans]